MIVSLVFSIATFLAQAQNDGRAVYTKSDKKLNDVYQKLLRANRSNTTFIRNLRTAERMWIQFRDAQFTLEYPKHVLIDKADSIPMDQAICLARLTEDRTKTLLELLKTSRSHEAYVSDLKIIYSNHVHAGIGIDKPYWADELIICGTPFTKGLSIHPESGGIVGIAEFLLPEKGGQLLGIAGWADEIGVSYNGTMRFRFFVDGDLFYAGEIRGKSCEEVNLNLRSGKVLRIEVDDGGDGNFSDHMAFGDLRIVY